MVNVRLPHGPILAHVNADSHNTILMTSRANLRLPLNQGSPVNLRCVAVQHWQPRRIVVRLTPVSLHNSDYGVKSTDDAADYDVVFVKPYLSSDGLRFEVQLKVTSTKYDNDEDDPNIDSYG